MGFPFVTLLDRLGLSTAGISRDSECTGIRFRTPGDTDPHILYMERKDPGAVLHVDGFSIPVRGNADEWFNRINGWLDRFHGWELNLGNLLLTRRLNEAMGLLSEIFGNAVYLVDSSFRVLAIDTNEEYSELSAIWKHLVNNGYIPYHILTGLRSSGEMAQLQSQKKASLFYSKWFNNRFINCCLYHDNALWGHLFVVGYRKGFTEGDLALAQWVGHLLEKVLMQFSNPIPSRNNDHEAFFLHVIERSLTDPAQIRNQLKPLGWDMEARFQAVAIRAEQEYRHLAPLLCDKLENRFHCRALVWKDVVLAVFPVEQSLAGIRNLISVFVQQESLTAGISDVFDGFYRLPLNAEQAVCALTIGQRTPGTLTGYRDVAISHLVQNLQPEFNLNMFCDKAVFRLRDYDQANDSDYLHTLDTFLRLERKLVDTADALFIHRNTLIYRIDRIQKLTGLELDDPDVRLRVLLSCRILEDSEGTRHNSNR